MRAFILLLLLPAIVLAENTVQTSSLFDRLKTLAEKAITNIESELTTFFNGLVSELQLYPLLLQIDVNNLYIKEIFANLISDLKKDDGMPILAIGKSIYEFGKILVDIGGNFIQNDNKK